MEEFVQLSLNTYDSMRERINQYVRENTILNQELNDEKEEKERIINKAEAITKKLHEHIMKIHLESWRFREYPYDELVGFDEWNFAMNDKKVLFKLGITEEEMVNYVKEAYAKWEEEEKD